MAVTIAYLTSGTSWTPPSDVTEVDVLIVAGGGAGQGKQAGNLNPRGGGGAGGVKELTSYAVTPSVPITIAIGAGGTSGFTSTSATSGQDSSFDGETATGGGRGGSVTSGGEAGNGGSGGGTITGGTPGTGIPGQGFGGGGAGSLVNGARSGGGGGFSSAGESGGAAQVGGHGGIGYNIMGTKWEVLVAAGLPGGFAGGGGGGAYRSSGTQIGGSGNFGGGNGGTGSTTVSQGYGGDGQAGTGGGGGGAGGNSSSSGNSTTGGAGGSGFIAILFDTATTPTFTSITPDEGPQGTAVTIEGANFTGITKVFFNGIEATSLVVVDDDTLTCNVPTGALGDCLVVVQTDLGYVPFGEIFISNEPIRVTQVPLLLVHGESVPIRVTQVPILMVVVPDQAIRVTQIPILIAQHPTPIPLPIPVVPEVPVQEIWSWKTTLNISERGKEQRSALRAHPRMSLSFDALIMNEEDRLHIYQMLFKYVKQTFNYPMYHYSTRMTDAAIIGDTKLYFNPAYTDVRDNEVAALYDPYTEKTKLVTLTSVDSDGANLAEELTFDVPEYCLICPAPLFKLENPSYSFGSVSGSLSLNLEGAQVRDVLRPDQSTTLTTLDNLLVLDKRPLANNPSSKKFNQDVTWLDNQIATPEPRTSWLTPFISEDKEYLIHRPDMDYWRAVASYMKGRQKPFLVPTFHNDLPLYETPALGATQFRTSNVQFFDFWRSKGWKYLRIQSDAGVIYRRVIEVLDHYSSDGQPIYMTVRLSASIGSGTGANSNMIISFLNTCRLDSDDIILEHDYVDTTISFKIRIVEE